MDVPDPVLDFTLLLMSQSETLKTTRVVVTIRESKRQKSRGGGMADALRSGRSVRKGMGVQLSPSAPE